MAGVMSLKPNQRRRLAAEQAIYRKFNSLQECNKACNDYCLKKGLLDITFNERVITQYVCAAANLSLKRLKVLAAVLNVTNYPELDEIYTAPRHRGEGDFWVGENGNKVQDINIAQIKL